ncbi:hypothetical protein JX265_011932 [Neoarthrinium moseri]|uniref:RZ-type domain-containing protein n=1 Tax=Neoarthrinium moseri TaxID=1658444 RepID=A0A9P9WBG8_9PEZI|nr:hypothetical protein JX265_011932 [Neoarthrinium moseri]
MALQYQDIDLDEDPCIFPDCGHFVTKSSMDGVMDMKTQYLMSPDGLPVEVSGSSVPFSMDEIKCCPTCRGSLRNISRYGRIVRRAMLDEATKKFIAWSNNEYLQLAQRLVDIQQRLTEKANPVFLPQNSRPSKLVIVIRPRLKQLYAIRDHIGGARYAPALKLWHHISEFIGKVRKEEQPFQRVADFIQHSQKQRSTENSMYNETLIQVGGMIQGLALWLRCETIILSDFMKIRQYHSAQVSEIRLDLTGQMNDCERLIDLANTSRYPRQQVEGHVFSALFCLVSSQLASESTEKPQDEAESSCSRETLKTKASAHLATARRLLQDFPSTRVLEVDVEAAETMLGDGVFYATVSADEMRVVYQAMAREFSGTGHWYTCESGHPFTVGECGMPTEQARCPECGGEIGGRNHNPAAGVRRADEIEELARGVGDIGIAG